MKHAVWSLALVAVASFSPAAADDFAPADYRGLPLSVYCVWEFAGGASPSWDYILPDITETYVNDDDPATFLYDGLQVIRAHLVTSVWRGLVSEIPLVTKCALTPLPLHCR